MTSVDRETTERIVQFHGHMCPGLAMGIRAAEVALTQIGEPNMETRVRLLEGRQLFLPCFDRALAGSAAVAVVPRPT